MGVLTARRTLTAAAVAACLTASAAAAAVSQPGTAEADIKAAFLFNFTKFIDWPAPGTRGPFRVCTVAEPAFDAAVDRTLAGESAGGRALTRVTPQTPADARQCQILFVGRHQQAARWIAAVRGAPVLVVGEAPSAWDDGAAIVFVLEDNRVKFDVNEEAGAGAGLTMSSKLLRVARVVRGRRRT